MSLGSRFVFAAVVAAGIGGALYWWRRPQAPPPSPPPVAQVLAPSTPPPPPPPDASEPAIRHPIAPSASEPRALPPLAESDALLGKVLGDLLGRKSVLSFLNINGFVNRFVATVDNLAREQATIGLWPVIPMAGRFGTETRADASVISTQNADRYAAFVRFAEAVDTRRAVALYVRLYPLCQRAYEDLGYPGKYFNDRVVEVIDHLLATPEVAGPIEVKLPEVPGAIKPTTPGSLYQFKDAALEARSAGQKILLRVGRENAVKLKAKLVDIRHQLTR